ncbi:hypothetical protein UY3_02064 [Chelonia mydas]|uniref:Uncharacterized protein n=1 Tax=Chelonia mydas TaxID=8469 RepID=M7CIC7_CHEMY|nr:hypothetical protein UY3_02064 [Chelonia mydas]
MPAWSPDPEPTGRPTGSKRAIGLGPATGAARRLPVKMIPLVCGARTGSGCVERQKTWRLTRMSSLCPTTGGRSSTVLESSTREMIMNKQENEGEDD